MFVDFILKKMSENKNKDAVIWNNKVYDYGYILQQYRTWLNELENRGIKNSVVAIKGDYNPSSITLLLALIQLNNIVVPFSHLNTDIDEKLVIAQAEYYFEFEKMEYQLNITNVNPTHNLIASLVKRSHPGIIIFSSGSTGKPKAAIHDFTKLLNKFMVGGYSLRTINFLLFDHWGGLNTLFYIFSNAGVVGVPIERTPDEVCKFIEKYKIELLPTTPTFINLILMSRAHEKYDLSSLKIVSYGTESMPETTLQRFHDLYPNIKMKQTYGLTELGVMRTKSKHSNSLWVKVGGEDYKTKIVNDTLYIKAESTILGYLNAESPYDSEGWYNTGDKVEQDGDWIKFLGRQSEIINVGGQKVFPAEVESILLGIDNIVEAVVYGKPNPITGQIVAARLTLKTHVKATDIKKLIRLKCKTLLESYKIPAYVEVTTDDQISERFKKVRI
jgi:long-chain acyl-CoA synthetase